MQDSENIRGLNLLHTVRWDGQSLVLIDQTKLPQKLEYVHCNNYQEVAAAIKNLVVRGAPAIGVTAAFGLALAARNSSATSFHEFRTEMDDAFEILRSTRPTAINLFWALERVMDKIRPCDDISTAKTLALRESLSMASEDIQINKSMGLSGSSLFNDGDVIMTHCNAGSLATVAYGTALGVIRAVKESGKNIKVIATETRPVMQGSRLTAFELMYDNIDVSLVPDTAVGHLMSQGKIHRVIVGADRVLRTGHVFNKIGTYQVAILAKMHSLPFYVAAPTSTFDLKSNPQDVIIEERPIDEVIKVGGRRIAPKGIKVFNPAFDMTPPELISSIVTEKGVIYPPYSVNIEKILN